MTKLLRLIRRKLIYESNLKKYIRYAFGEIILIVIGILIAVWINNLSENRIKAKLEQEMLVNLAEDFESNRQELEKVIKTTNRNIKYCSTILKYSGNRSSRKSFKLDSVLNHVVSSPDYISKNGYINDLINSGNLNLIKSSLLRNKLSSWLPTDDMTLLKQNLVKEFEREIIRFVIKNGNWLNVDEEIVKNYFKEDIKNYNLPKSGFQTDNNKMLKLVEFENRIENQYVHFSTLRSKYEALLKLNNEILSLIELEKN